LKLIQDIVVDQMERIKDIGQVYTKIYPWKI